MARDLRGKTIIVTGGGAGIGLAIADEFLRNGAGLAIILDFNENVGSKATEDLNNKYGKNKAVFLKCDVSKDLEKTFKYVIDTYKSVDVLVNNAGIADESNPRKVIDVNVTAVIEWSFKFIELNRTDKGNKGGTIMNVASVYGYYIDHFVPVYKASKFAVMGFTKSKGHQYNFEKTGVRIVAICPGFTRTNLTRSIDVKDDLKLTDEYTAIRVTSRQDPEDVGKAAVEVFQRAESGTAWEIKGGEPIKEV